MQSPAAKNIRRGSESASSGGDVEDNIIEERIEIENIEAITDQEAVDRSEDSSRTTVTKDKQAPDIGGAAIQDQETNVVHLFEIDIAGGLSRIRSRSRRDDSSDSSNEDSSTSSSSTGGSDESDISSSDSSTDSTRSIYSEDSDGTAKYNNNKRMSSSMNKSPYVMESAMALKSGMPRRWFR